MAQRTSAMNAIAIIAIQATAKRNKAAATSRARWIMGISRPDDVTVGLESQKA
jgi:hypothetical protein